MPTTESTRLAAVTFTDAEAEKLGHFADLGYLTFSLGLDDRFFEAFDDDLDRLWEERPADLAVAAELGGPTSFRDCDAGAPKCRLPHRRPHIPTPTHASCTSTRRCSASSS